MCRPDARSEGRAHAIVIAHRLPPSARLTASWCSMGPHRRAGPPRELVAMRSFYARLHAMAQATCWPRSVPVSFSPSRQQSCRALCMAGIAGDPGRGKVDRLLGKRDR